MNILVVGGAGFIGHHVVRRLVTNSHQVRVLDCFHDTYDPHRKWTNVRDLVRDDRIQLVVGDVRDRDALNRSLAVSGAGKAVDAIVNLATPTSAVASFDSASECFDVATTGTTTLLEAARAHRVKHVLLTSSSAVYGTVAAAVTEDTPFAAPTSPYAIAKRTLESIAELHAVEGQLRVTVTRLFSVFGPGQPDAMLIPTALRQHLSSEPLPLFAGGAVATDLVHVDDVVAGLVACLDRSGPAFRVYNLGSGHGVTALEVVDELERLTGRTIARTTASARRGDSGAAIAVINRAREELRYAPSILWRDGLARLVANATDR